MPLGMNIPNPTPGRGPGRLTDLQYQQFLKRVPTSDKEVGKREGHCFTLPAWLMASPGSSHIIAALSSHLTPGKMRPSEGRGPYSRMHSL